MPVGTWIYVWSSEKRSDLEVYIYESLLCIHPKSFLNEITVHGNSLKGIFSFTIKLENV